MPEPGNITVGARDPSVSRGPSPQQGSLALGAPSIDDVFWWIARLEGCSLLLLLGVAMPLKYVLKLGEPNAYIGWAHGSLFVLYLLCLGSVRRSSKEPALTKWMDYGLGVVASGVPGGTFALEWALRRKRAMPTGDFQVTPPSST